MLLTLPATRALARKADDDVTAADEVKSAESNGVADMRAAIRGQIAALEKIIASVQASVGEISTSADAVAAGDDLMAAANNVAAVADDWRDVIERQIAAIERINAERAGAE